MPLHVLDTDVWIHLWREHPPDIFRNLWQQLDASIANGDIQSPEEVRHELERGTDDLAESLAARDGLFAPLDDALQEAVRLVMNDVQGLTDPDGERNRADPFVVALARIRTGSVVTREKPRRHSTAPPKIPDACRHYGIPCLDWFGFLRAIGWEL